MLDSVLITGLECETIVGVYDFERHAPRPLLVDLEMGWDNRPAGLTDDLAQALNYDAVSQCVRRVISDQQPELIETLAESVAQALFAEFGMPWLIMTLHKPGAVAGTQSLAVRIHRENTALNA